MLELWRRYGEENFQVEVLEELDYRDESDDPADYKEELEQLRDLCLERDESASLLWARNRLHAAERATSRKDVNSCTKRTFEVLTFPYR